MDAGVIARLFAAAALALWAGAVLSQETSTGSAGLIRVLDRTTGRVTDLEITVGDLKTAGRLDVSLGECRYPAGDPAGDAYAWVTIFVRGTQDPVFRGWMLASAPALNAMDHPRYDVWVLRCITS